MDDADASTTQRDRTTPFKTGGSEIVCDQFEVRHSVRVVIAEHKTERQNRAGLGNVASCQVPTANERVGSGSDDNLHRALSSFEPVMGIGMHSELHESARAEKRPLLFRFFAVEKTTAHSAANDFSNTQFQLVLR